MLVAMLTSIFRWRMLKHSERIISVLLMCTVLSEIFAYYFMTRYSNNMYVYHVFSPLEFVFISVYYNQTVSFLKRNYIGILIAFLGCVAALVNALHFQPIDTFPSLFLLFEGFIIIILSLLSFFDILYKEDYKLVRNPQFWITFNFLIFWSFTFLIWGTYISFSTDFRAKLPMIFNMLSFINLIEYLIFLLIFLFYPKMIDQGE